MAISIDRAARRDIPFLVFLFFFPPFFLFDDEQDIAAAMPGRINGG